jgi:hypothetical protein
VTLAEQFRAGLNWLSDSPTFAMSLGAKELFHTNFLAFLLESEDPLLEPLRRALRKELLFPVADSEVSTCAVWREKKHLDLLLVPFVKVDSEPTGLALSRERAHVVEAKLKSIPTAEQLKRYDEALEKGFELASDEDSGAQALWLGAPKRNKTVIDSVSKVLLSTSGHIVRDGWQPCTWEQVSKAISSNLPPTDGSAMSMVLRDYAGSLDHITALISGAANLARTLVANDSPYKAMLDAAGENRFKQMRLRDLVSKVMFDEWLRAELGKLASSPGLQTDAYVVYTNSSPGIGIEYYVPSKDSSNSLRIGVQIQATEFRHYVAAVDDAKKLVSTALSQPLSSKWLQVPTRLGPLVGKSRGSSKYPDDLRAFDRERFVFRCSAIDEKRTFSQLSQALHESLALARNLVNEPAVRALAEGLA